MECECELLCSIQVQVNRNGKSLMSVQHPCFANFTEYYHSINTGLASW